jgi:hypothetical protein
MAEMDPTAKYHRTLRGLVWADGNRDVIKNKTRLGFGYAFVGEMLKRLQYFQNEDQDFKKYATAWEIFHSKVPFGEGSGTVFPVIDREGVVSGHYGWFESDHFFVPANLQSALKVEEVPVRGTWGLPRIMEIERKRLSLKDYLEIDADVIADRYQGYYLKRGYARWVPTPQLSFEVMTDIEGHVLLVLSRRDKDGIERSAFSPLDLIAVVKVVGGLLAAGSALALRTYLRRKAVLALTSAERPLLAKFSQSTEEEIAALMGEHPRLSRVNAERAVVGPPGSVPEAYGPAGAPEIAKGIRPKSADIQFRVPTAKGSSTVLRREVKTWDGDPREFTNAVRDAANKMQAHGGGELLVQVPAATDARALVQGFKGTIIKGSPVGVEKFGRYRSIRIKIVDPSGTVLLEEALEFPPSRYP